MYMLYHSRDLKPENILLNEAMHIQITDFGTAKILTEEGGTCQPTVCEYWIMQTPFLLILP